MSRATGHVPCRVRSITARAWRRTSVAPHTNLLSENGYPYLLAGGGGGASSSARLSLSLFSLRFASNAISKKTPRDGRHRRAARRTPKLESVGRRSSPHTDSHSSHALRGGRSTQPGSPQHPLPPLWRRRGPTPIAGASNPHPCITPHNVCALHGLPPRLPSPRLHLAAPARGKERTTACAAQDSLHAGGSRKFFGVPSGTASSSSLFSLARRAREAS